MDAIEQLDTLVKAGPRGGKYYRRVATGDPKRPWKYYYTRAAYEKEHGDKAHVNGGEVKQVREKIAEADSHRQAMSDLADKYELSNPPDENKRFHVHAEHTHIGGDKLQHLFSTSDDLTAAKKTAREIRDTLDSKNAKNIEIKVLDNPASSGQPIGAGRKVYTLTTFDKSEGNMDAIDQLAKAARKKTPHPVSEAQRRWAFGAEQRGELPKGKAIEWSRRVKGKDLPASKAAIGMLADLVGKRTPGIRRALRALAEAKNANVERVARGESPVIAGEKVSVQTLNRHHGAPGSKKEAKERLAGKMTDIEMIGKLAEKFGKKDEKPEANANSKDKKPPFGKQGDQGKKPPFGKQDAKGKQPPNGKPQPGDAKQYQTKVKDPESGEIGFQPLSEKERPENARFVVSDETSEGAHWEAPEDSEHYEHFKQWKAARKQGMQGTDIPKELVEGAMQHAQKHHYDAGPHKAAYDDYLAHQNSNGAPKVPPSHHTMKNGNGGSHPTMRSKDEQGKQMPPKKGKQPPQMVGKMQVARYIPRVEDTRTYGVARSGTERPTVGSRANAMEDRYQELYGMCRKKAFKSMDAIDRLSVLSKAGGGYHKYIGRKKVGDKWQYEYEHSETGAKKTHDNPMEHFHQVFGSYNDPNKKTKDKHPSPHASANALRAVAEHAKDVRPKERNEILKQIRGYQKLARTHTRNMDNMHRRSAPKDLSRQVTRNDFLQARNVRDHLEETRAHITEAAKTPEKKAKEKAASEARRKKQTGVQREVNRQASQKKLDEMRQSYERATAKPFTPEQQAALPNFMQKYRELAATHERVFGEKPKGILPETGYEYQKRVEAAGQQRFPGMKSEGSAPMYRQDGDTFELHKGLYAYDDQDGKSKDLPDSYLFEYLAGFVKEAIGSYSCREKLKALTAGEDIYARAAQEAMYELVQRMPKDKNLMRASKKFKVTQQSLTDIIKQRNFIATPSDSKPSGRDYDPASTYFNTDWDSMTSMGVTNDNGPTGEVMVLSAKNPWAQGAPGLKLSDEPEHHPVVAHPGNPFGDIGVLHKSRVNALYQDEPVRPNMDSACPIHGTRDLTKDQSLQHTHGTCSCKK